MRPRLYVPGLVLAAIGLALLFAGDAVIGATLIVLALVGLAVTAYRWGDGGGEAPAPREIGMDRASWLLVGFATAALVFTGLAVLNLSDLTDGGDALVVLWFVLAAGAVVVSVRLAGALRLARRMLGLLDDGETSLARCVGTAPSRPSRLRVSRPSPLRGLIATGSRVLSVDGGILGRPQLGSSLDYRQIIEVEETTQRLTVSSSSERLQVSRALPSDVAALSRVIRSRSRGVVVRAGS